MASPQYRKNGLSPPYSKMQIGTWIALPLLVLQFGFFCTPILPFALSIPITLLFLVLAIACFYYGLLASIIDPMDPYLARHLAEQEEEREDEQAAAAPSRRRHNNNNNNKGNPLLACIPIPDDDEYSAGRQTTTTTAGGGGGDDTKYCWVCETTVASHSMHCKYCNKCVSNFDHHCQWLNSCVGTANYPYFNRVLWSISGFLLVHISVMLGLVLDIFLKGDSERRADAWFNDAGLSAFVAAVNLLFIAFDGVALSLIVQLLLFHLSLQRKGLTTYQFILEDNQRKREARKATEALKAKRTVAIGHAKRDGNDVLAMRLKLGAYCALCDPLPKEVVENEQKQAREDLALEVDNEANHAATNGGGEIEMANGTSNGGARNREGLNGNGGGSARFG